MTGISTTKHKLFNVRKSTNRRIKKIAQRNSYCLVYHSQKNAEPGALGIAQTLEVCVWGKKAYPSPEAAVFQACRVVEDKALADMLAEVMQARQDERMQEIGKDASSDLRK